MACRKQTTVQVAAPLGDTALSSRAGSERPRTSAAPGTANWLIMGLILLLCTVLLGIVWSLHVWKGIPVGKLVRDPVTVANVPVYYGFLSQLGIFIWASTAAVCLFSYKVISASLQDSELTRFFLIAGCLTLLLGFDDAFLLHDEVFPRLGVEEHLVFVGYALFVGYFLARFFPMIWRTDFALLAMALIFFSFSIVVDAFELESTAGRLMEDGAKLVGMMSWLAYFAVTGFSAVNRHVLRPSKMPRNS